MKRALAIGFAIAMIVGALAIRHALDGDGSGTGSSAGVGDKFRLTCATELREVCSDAFGGDGKIVLKFENPGRTTDALVGANADDDPGFDAWLSAGPWSEILADNRRFSGAKGGPLGEESGVLARSPVVIVMVTDAAKSQATDACGADISWTCLVDHVQGTPGGVFRLGVPDLGRSDGLAVATSAVNSLFDSTDYSASELDQGDFSPYFEDLTKLARSAKLGNRTVLQTALIKRGSFSVVGTLEAETAVLSSDSRDLTVRYPEPIVTADVRLSTRKGLGAQDGLDELGSSQLAKALAANGWRVQGEVAVPGVNGAKELPPTSNLPAPGALQLLRDEWDN